MEARGPGKCGLMIDILTPNPLRTKPELKSILKKHEYYKKISSSFHFTDDF